MEKIINKLKQIPRWYGIAIVLLYSFLLAEFYSTFNRFLPIDNSMGNLFSIISKISYSVTILSGVIVWIIITFLFHLTALLFNGKSSFSQILFVSSYPYIIPAIVIIIGIFILDGIQIQNAEDVIVVLMENQSFKLSMNLINYSFIPYYVTVAILIHDIYQINYLYAILSVTIPIVAIWLIGELFKLI